MNNLVNRHRPHELTVESNFIKSFTDGSGLLAKVKTNINIALQVDPLASIQWWQHSLWNLVDSWKYHYTPFSGHKAIHPVRTIVNPTFPTLKGDTP